MQLLWTRPEVKPLPTEKDMNTTHPPKLTPQFCFSTVALRGQYYSHNIIPVAKTL